MHSSNVKHLCIHQYIERSVDVYVVSIIPISADHVQKSNELPPPFRCYLKLIHTIYNVFFSSEYQYINSVTL